MVFNQPRPDDGLVNMLTDGATIPGVHMRRVDALEGLFDGATATPPIGTAGEDFQVIVEFDGWGYRAPVRQGDWRPSGCLRKRTGRRHPRAALRPGDRIRAVGAWIAAGGSNFWGVEQFTNSDGTRLIAGSDRDFRLVILRYTGPGAAAAPSCSGGTARTGVGQAVRLPLTCADANGNTLSRRIVQGPANGSLGAIQGDSVLYTPNAGFTGSDSVRFVANDGADSQPATTTVAVDTATVPTRPSNNGKIKLGKYRHKRLVVRVKVPWPGRLDVSMRANVRRGGKASTAKVKRMARATKRPKRARWVRVVLKPSKAKHRPLKQTLKVRKRVKVTVRTAFKLTGGTTGRKSVKLVIRRR